MKTTPLPENRSPTATLPGARDAGTAEANAPASSRDAGHATAPADDRAAPAMPTAMRAHETEMSRDPRLRPSPSAAIAIIVALGAMLFILNLGTAPLYTKGEPREAVTVFDIVHGGGVILPLRAGVEIPSKPLLMHWLAALVSPPPRGG